MEEPAFSTLPPALPASPAAVAHARSMATTMGTVAGAIGGGVLSAGYPLIEQLGWRHTLSMLLAGSMLGGIAGYIFSERTWKLPVKTPEAPVVNETVFAQPPSHAERLQNERSQQAENPARA